MLQICDFYYIILLYIFKTKCNIFLTEKPHFHGLYINKVMQINLFLFFSKKIPHLMSFRSRTITAKRAIKMKFFSKEI